MSGLEAAAPTNGVPPPTRTGGAVRWHCQSVADRFVDKIIESEKGLIAALRGMIQPIRDRSRRKPHAPIRKQRMIDLAREWTVKMDTPSRLGLVIDYDPDGRGMLITECRVACLAFNMAGWPDDHFEDGLSVALVRLRVAPHKTGLTAERLALVSRHSLGRRVQCDPRRVVDSDILDDLRCLAIKHDDLVKHKDLVSCPANKD